ncbi:helix-turn-helix transcriptional regulator [Mesorhizobium sp. CAU 1741]|uniref:helix-turn-helix transcriptional regulator n=1 Tax=Mesorhizobium sp. CAU 1741 TaxID=3140366 RepID=UPI00325C178D
MSFHSRSAISFGQLLNTLSVELVDGAPVEAALAVVRAHFEADVVVLEIERRGREAELFLSAADGVVCDAPALAELQAGLRSVYASSNADDTHYGLRLFRATDHASLSQDDCAVAEVLVAHIARALELAARIDGSAVEKSLYSDALDRLNVGVILVDQSGRLCSVSALAERFLASRDGIQAQLGRLRATSASEDRLLQSAIRDAISGDGIGVSRGISLTKESGARTLGVMVRPMAGRRPGAVARAVVYVRDCDVAPEVESEFVRQIFDLTPAEAAVTRRLTSGLSLEDAATSLDISRNTARAHLRSIFSKSGISRQTELVRLVLNSAALLGETKHHPA